MITIESKINFITFDIKFPNGKWHDIILDYSPEVGENWCLSMEDIHNEDNDSWNAIDIEDENIHCDIQFYGWDEEFNYSNLINIPLHFQIGMCELNEDNDWEHTGEWLNSDDVQIKNVKIHTDDGIKRIKVI